MNDLDRAAVAAKGDRAKTSELLRGMRVLCLRWARHWRLNIPREDAVQIALMGVVRAVESYDPEMGVPFTYWASQWARSALSGGRAKYALCSGVGARIRSGIHEGIEGAVFSSPIVEERTCHRQWRPKHGFADLTDHGLPVDEQCDEREQERALRDAMSKLTRREREVILLRLEYSYREIARKMGISKDGARKIEQRAMRRLKEITGEVI